MSAIFPDDPRPARTVRPSDVDIKKLSIISGKDFVRHDASMVQHNRSEQEQRGFERRTMRHVDWRLIPLLAVVYSIALIDRINLGASRTAGMGADLALSVGTRYSTVTCVYFIFYVLLQVPGNLVVRRFGPRIFLSVIVLSWGGVELGMAFSPTWKILALCRILLGAFEAAFFPALVLIIQTWYTRHEVQKRLAAFYMSSITVSGFSNILAYAISLMDGKQGIRGWRWIFIIEGAFTVLLGLITYIFIVDFPDQNKFLTPEQTKFVLDRIDQDRGDAIPDEITFQKVTSHLGDWTIWAYGTMFMCASMPSYALAYFISIILAGMGYSTKNALLLSAGPYGPALITSLFFAWLADRTKTRAPWIAIQTVICLIGLAVTAYARVGSVRYFGTFLINAGASGCIPGILAYMGNNYVTHSKRSVATAVTVACAGLGGVFASLVFREQDYPMYIPGLWATMGCQLLMLVILVILTFHYRRQNNRVRAGEVLLNTPGFLYTL